MNGLKAGLALANCAVACFYSMAGSSGARAEPGMTGAPVARQAWPAAEVAAARARCASLLKSTAAVAIPEPPVRQGPCGAPAPIRLLSVGKSPQVSFSPPALVTCEMAAALNAWVERDLQPLARKHLGAEIIAIETMSDYSCRTIFGRARLSEHSRANALDIRGFLTARAQGANVLAGWGATTREREAVIAAGKLAPFSTTVVPSVSVAKAPGPRPLPARTIAAADPIGDFARTLWNGAESPGKAAIGFAPPEGGAGLRRDSPHATPAPNWLGGRRADAVPANAAPANGPHAAFLRAAHRSACAVFGTVLGPEADAAHRNHFHVDMATRASGHFCE